MHYKDNLVLRKLKVLLQKQEQEYGIQKMKNYLINLKLQQLYQTGIRTPIQSYMNDNRLWMPLILFPGVINMVTFASMMSFRVWQ